MKRKRIALIAAGVIIVGVVTGYTLLDKSLGNNVQIESVIPGKPQQPVMEKARLTLEHQQERRSQPTN